MHTHVEIFADKDSVSLVGHVVFGRQKLYKFKIVPLGQTPTHVLL